MKIAIFLLAAAAACAADKPVASANSEAEGKSIFMRRCTGCHGMNGKAGLEDVPEATDLTNPKAFKNGVTEGEIFRSIRDGRGTSMPSFQADVQSDDEIWHLVNFVRSLWPK